MFLKMKLNLAKKIRSRTGAVPQRRLLNKEDTHTML